MTMGRFGSRSIALRPKLHKNLRADHVITKYWTGPFRFFDLPPELRDHILRLALSDATTSGRVIGNLLLTSQRIYAEAASIFYSKVSLEIEIAERFLTGSLTRVAPRQFVRNLTMRFEIKNQIELFGESYGTALNEMAEEGQLQHLRLEVKNCFPSCEFWGYEDCLTAQDSIRVPNVKGNEILLSAPHFLTDTPFQSFLRFLDESKIPKITLWVDAMDHSNFWCPFHRVHPKGRKCDGEWKGSARLLKIHRSNLVKALRGAEAIKPMNDC
ncbi:hypothetical protein F5Y05DRAFT_55338 [Hypoxylon sp. FL0543]|nr:hypothetical protein F5Y05DRAFT_55338 [Hypoxylon sp. FL0543]